eukprot:m.53450 g.53450  ORF g.53450 m.53450 type:complete len:786 (+) comp16662_c0_seq1:3100-5457(+)
MGCLDGLERSLLHAILSQFVKYFGREFTTTCSRDGTDMGYSLYSLSGSAHRVAPSGHAMSFRRQKHFSAPPFRKVLCDSSPTPLDRSSSNFVAELAGYQTQIHNYAREQGIKAVFTLIGHGSKNQIAHVGKVAEELQPLAAKLDKKYGQGCWAVCYGGDPYNPKKPDIGALAKIFWEKFRARVIAVQCDDYADYLVENGSIKDGAAYAFVDAAVLYKTERTRTGVTQFGGTHSDTLHHVVGSTRYILLLFGGDMAKPDGSQLLKGAICCGGGPVSLQECQEKFQLGFPIYYHPVEAQIAICDPTLEFNVDGVDEDWEVGVELQKYGIVQQWVEEVGLPTDTWIMLNRNPRGSWAEDVKKKQTAPLDVYTDLWKVASPAEGDNRIVIDPNDMQREIEISVEIIQVYDVDEKSFTVGIDFIFTAQVEVELPQASESGAAATVMPGFGFDSDPAWNPPHIQIEAFRLVKTEPSFDLIQDPKQWECIPQSDPTDPRTIRAFRRFRTSFNGTFRYVPDLKPFPFDIQHFDIKFVGGDIEKERFVPLTLPPATSGRTAGFSAPAWSMLVHKQDGSGWKKYDPWVNLRFGETGSDTRTGVSHRTARASFLMSRKPWSVIYNIGVPALLLSMAIGLVYTIPLDDGKVKDERLGIAFVIFLTFVTLKIVVMDTLPPLPYMTLIERYLLYVLLFVGAVSASNSIMIFNSSDGEGSTKGDAFDSYSMWSSLILWVLVHARAYYDYRRNTKAYNRLMQLADLDVVDDVEVRRNEGVLRRKATAQTKEGKASIRVAHD